MFGSNRKTSKIIVDIFRICSLTHFRLQEYLQIGKLDEILLVKQVSKNRPCHTYGANSIHVIIFTESFFVGKLKVP